MLPGPYSTMAERRIVIVGGGITGLAAAHAATKRASELGRRIQVTVLERLPRFGGNVVTERVDGFLMDGGPDSWVTSKPYATALACELGLEKALVATDEANRSYYVAWGDRLYAVPEGLVLGVPTRLAPLARSRLFSWRGKVRMALEPFVRARPLDGDADESIAEFVERRLGREATERLVAPLLGGISAGDASEISIRATFPQLVAMERDHGSLVRGMWAAARVRKTMSRRGAETSAFLSLEGGVGELVCSLVDWLRAAGVTLRTSSAARALARDESWTVHLETGERLGADAVLLAVPAHVAKSLVGGVHASLASVLASIAHGSTATVFLAYRKVDIRHPLDGVGFVVPSSLGRPILAGTWVSSKWRGRAPEGHVLLRVFFGGPRGEGILGRDDQALGELARDELRAIMGLTAEPLWSRVFRFEATRAQMRVGHLATMRVLREELARALPGVWVAGDGYDGAGIPDCIRQGQDAGCAMVQSLTAVAANSLESVAPS
jgi:oxygen-dependent protoporphyrinogen oxidase